ncbi:MAG: sigma-54-dependent Fis family transcriptional regulator [Kofleriaceae bacterium]|nr:sigma-54-dependent Fis family transcriptional regulator [Kofleriaceae bacterium]MCB9571392.1 sigma-54-dependent Fis family transcriptional regulator [Kofleriaceae bacterium]
MTRVLVVDDDRSIRRTLEKFLAGEGYDVVTAGDGVEARAVAPGADVILLDLGLPGADGFEVLGAVRAEPHPPPVVVITAREDMQSTVRAVQLGAYEYLVKPLDIDRLRLVVRRAAESRQAERALGQFVAREAESYQVGNIIGRSVAIREVYKQIGAVSTSRASVLVRGESGTGKELVAKAVHYASADRDQPFVAINCTAFARDLLESELFGHVRGAFTGAIADKVGRFELAGTGTLFLDEVAELPVDLQAKLLRVLQERSFERVGDARAVPLRARVIAATHRDLDAMVADGSFREDLLYRLRVVEIHLPPLRDRGEDLALLVDGLLTKINRELHKQVRLIPRETMEALAAYPWPGNVRELENALTRAVVLSQGEVLEARHLPMGTTAAAAPARRADVEPGAGALAAPRSLREVEREHIAAMLAHTDWNKRRACAILEISRPTLDRKIDDYRLVRPDAAGGDGDEP